MGDFTTNWHSRRIPIWRDVFKPFEGQSFDYLEIGSYEGRSALFIAENYPRSRLTCVDLWTDPKIKERFDKNLASHQSRMHVLHGRSTQKLDELAQAEASFDIIYIDGDHSRQTAFTDTALSWPLLRVNGLMIWDDYGYGRELPEEKRPRAAINLFLHAFAPCLQEVRRGGQVIVRKTRDWPNPSAPFAPAVQARRFLTHLKARKF